MGDVESGSWQSGIAPKHYGCSRLIFVPTVVVRSEQVCRFACQELNLILHVRRNTDWVVLALIILRRCKGVRMCMSMLNVTASYPHLSHYSRCSTPLTTAWHSPSGMYGCSSLQQPDGASGGMHISLVKSVGGSTEGLNHGHSRSMLCDPRGGPKLPPRRPECTGPCVHARFSFIHQVSSAALLMCAFR